MPEIVTIKFTGDVSELKQAAREAVKALKSLNKQHKKQGDTLTKEEKKLIKYLNSLGLTDSAAKKASVSFGNLNKSMNLPDAPSGAQGLLEAADAAKKAQAEVEQLAKTQANANTVLLSFSQGIQDLPFGFIAVQNNITSLVAQFGFLQNRAGGLKESFKEIGKALSGPGGVLFAISTVVSVITILSMRSRTAKRDVNELTERIKGLGDGIKNTFDLMGASREGYARQATQLQALSRAALDVSKADDERLKAANKLRQIFPEQLDNLTDLDIISGKAAKSISKLTTELFKIAQANAVIDLVTDNYKTMAKTMVEQQKLVNSKKFKDDIQKIADAAKDVNDQFASSQQIGGGSPFGGLLAALRKSGAESTESIKALIEFNKILEEAGKANELLFKQFDPSAYIQKTEEAYDPMDRFLDLLTKINQNARLGDIFGGTDIQLRLDNLKDITSLIREFVQEDVPDANEAFKALMESYRALRQEVEIPFVPGMDLETFLSRSEDTFADVLESFKKLRTDLKNIDLVGSFFGDEQETILKQRAEALRKAISDALESGVTPIDPRIMIGGAIEGNFSEAELQLRDLIEQYKEVRAELDALAESEVRIGKITTTLQNVFDGVFTAMVNGNDVLESLVRTLAALAIKFAAAAAAAALLAGTGLVGGAGFMDIFGKLIGIPKKMAKGGYVSSPTLAMIGDAPGGEVVLNMGQLNSILNSGNRNVHITGEFRQRGNDLVAVVDNQRDINRIF